MFELITAIAAGLLWLSGFAACALLIRRRYAATPADSLLAAYPLFFAAQVVLVRLLDAFGLLGTAALLAIYALAATTALASLARRPARLPAPAGRGCRADAGAGTDATFVERLVIATAAAAIAALVIFTLVTPPFVWDVLAYHMPMIASYVQNASLEAWPTQDLRQVFRVNAGELQMLNVVLLARTDVWVELPNVLAFAICLLTTREVAREAGLRADVAALAVAVVLTAPQILVGAGTAKNDLVFTAALLGSFYWFLRAAAAPADAAGSNLANPYAALALSALCAALAAATKVMGLNVIGALGLLGMILVVRGRLSLVRLATFGAAAVVITLVLVGNVYLGNLSRSAVPVGVAPGEVWFTTGVANVVEAARYYAWELPLRRLIATQQFEHDFLHYGYAFPVILLLGLAGAARQARAPRVVPASLALVSAILFVSVIAVRLPIGWDQRFMIWIVPVLAVLALGWPVLSRESVLAATSAACALAFVNVALMLTNESDAVFVRSAQHLAAAGLPASAVHVTNRRYVFMSDGFADLDRAAASTDSVLYVGTDDSWMYQAWGPRFTRHVEGVWNAEHAATRIESRHFRFVVIENSALPHVREAVARSAAAAGYAPFIEAQGRTIVSRTDTPAAGSEE